MAFCEQCGAQILSKNPSPRSFSCIIRMPDGFYNHLAYFFVPFCFGGREPPFSARAPPSFEVYSMKLKIQEVYDGKEKYCR